MIPGGIAGVFLAAISAIAVNYILHRGMSPLNGAIGFGFAGSGVGAVAGTIPGGMEGAIVCAFVGLVIGTILGLMSGVIWWLGQQIIVRSWRGWEPVCRSAQGEGGE
jgi:ABC-type transport system involved in cytochrome c biogenesis permease subunit